MTTEIPDIPSDKIWMGCGRVAAKLDADKRNNLRTGSRVRQPPTPAAIAGNCFFIMKLSNNLSSIMVRAGCDFV